MRKLPTVSSRCLLTQHLIRRSQWLNRFMCSAYSIHCNSSCLHLAYRMFWLMLKSAFNWEVFSSAVKFWQVSCWITTFCQMLFMLPSQELTFLDLVLLVHQGTMDSNYVCSYQNDMSEASAFALSHYFDWSLMSREWRHLSKTSMIFCRLH